MEIKRFPLGALWTNGYLVWDEGGHAFLVDPGGEASEVRAFLEDKGLTLEWIVLTHGHGDHIGGLPQMRPLSRCGVAIHRDDADMLLEPGKNLSTFMGEPLVFDPAERILTDGEELAVGSLTVRVIHTPGHTPGGICLLVTEGEERVLFAGDTLFARSIGRTDLPGGSEELLEVSLRVLAELPDELRVLPGHGPETRIGEERRNNPFWPR